MVKMYYVVDEWVVNIVEPLEVAYVLSLFILTRKSISRIWMNYVFLSLTVVHIKTLQKY